MIRLKVIDGMIRTVCECDICGGRLWSVHQGVVLQPQGGPAKHVHRGKCCEIALDSFGWIRTQAALESHVSGLAALLTHTPPELEETPDGVVPAKVCEQLMARAWADETPDDDRLLLEQGATAIRELMRRCVVLARISEHGEVA